jgi:tetratricopeptide (TPR) repeat protein
MDTEQNEYNEITELVQEALHFRKSNNVESAMIAINKAVDIGMKLTKPTTEYAHCLHVKAQLFRDKGQLNQSFDDYYHAYKLYTSAGNLNSAFHSLWHSASVASDNEQHKDAKAIFRKCLWIMKDIQLITLEKVNFYRVMAIHEERIDNLIGAYGLWLHCLSLYDEVDIAEGISESKARIQNILDKISHLGT